MLLAELSSLVKGTRSDRFSLRDSLCVANPAWITLIASACLSLLGVYMIDVVEHEQGREAVALAPVAAKQLMLMLVAVSAAAVAIVPHYRFVSLLAAPGSVLVIALLVFLLIPIVPASIVSPRNGTRGWINLGPVDFQPAEVAKIVYVVVIARYLRFRSEHRRFWGLAPLGLITVVPVGLIMLQPDTGTAMLFIPALFAMLLAAGARLRHLSIIVVAAALAAPASYPLLMPHQKQRIVALAHQLQGDYSSAQGISFQPLTAQRLAGAGGVAGVGDARSRTLVHYNRLPEAHNDMIYAVIINRFGLLGGLAVLGLYFLWLLGAVLTAGATRDPFARLLVVGVAAFIACQAVINVAMNVGVAPIVGITLPFVSYGGSSVLACWLMAAMVFNVGLHRPLPPYRQSFEYGEGDG